MKKIILALVAMVAVAGGLVAMSAYEAHIINVTAHIENALTTHGGPISFGTVFPQEYTERDFYIQLSSSFQGQDPLRVNQVDYVIKQKTKCSCDDATGNECPLGQYAPVNYTDDQCPAGYSPMPSLCKFLSKLPKDNESGDVGVASYYNNSGTPSDPSDDYCTSYTGQEMASGYLNYSDDDYQDNWAVDLKVPPIDGTVAQDWPAGCPTVAQDSVDYGCDLWVEVTNISNVQPN